MIPLSKLRKMRERRAKEASVAAACDAQECGGVICTAEDPRTCRVHGIASLEREDLADKHKGEIDLTDAHCLRDLANSMSMREAEDEIAEHFSSVLSFADAEKLAKGSSSQSKAVRSETIQTKKCVAATICYLKRKFPRCNLPKNMTLVMAKNVIPHRKGRTVCHVSEKDYAIAICFAWDEDVSRGDCYSHGDYRNNFDYFRHELFHAIEAENEIVDFYGRIVKAVGRKVADAELMKVSKCALARHGESEAECFAKMTSPEYRHGMNEKVFEIVKNDSEGGSL